MHIPSDIGYRISRTRRMKGIKQETMAQALNINQPSYCKKEAGDISITEEELQTIAQTLQVSVDYIMQQTDTPSQYIDALNIHGSNSVHVNGTHNTNTFHTQSGLSSEDRILLMEAMKTLQVLTEVLQKLVK